MPLSLTSVISSNELLDWKDLQVIRPNGLDKWLKRSLQLINERFFN